MKIVEIPNTHICFASAIYYLDADMNVIKKIIPPSIKLFFRINQRRYIDQVSGNNKLFAKKNSTAHGLYPAITIEQPIKNSVSSVGKIHNLSVAITKLNNIIIQPGEIFSFWKLVGNPSQQNGYQKSRSIINGELEAAIGGGLCQLSGLIYFLALQAGLVITERHAHSIDIYTEEERFTPLGSDATVTYGYKDLRFINPYHFPLLIAFQLSADTLTGTILAEEKITPREIIFEYRKTSTHTEVDTIGENSRNSLIISTNRYKKLQQL